MEYMAVLSLIARLDDEDGEEGTMRRSSLSLVNSSENGVSHLSISHLIHVELSQYFWRLVNLFWLSTDAIKIIYNDSKGSDVNVTEPSGEQAKSLLESLHFSEVGDGGWRRQEENEVADWHIARTAAKLDLFLCLSSLASLAPRTTQTHSYFGPLR